MNAAEYESRFLDAGVKIADYPSILGGIRLASEKLAQARALLAGVPDGHAGCAVFAIGSMGRMEFTEASDLDLAFVYEREVMSDPSPHWNRVRSALRGAFDVSDKTFSQPYSFAGLITNIGGEEEKNRSLTYRALLLTEGEWVTSAGYAQQLYEKIIGVYRDAPTTRGRYLTSLSNDLHRYYRTLCVDYRHKVEEQKKKWAIRYIKLRHSRKLWHLGNVALECAAFIENERRNAPEGFHDGYLTDHLRDPPLAKILEALRLLGQVGLMRPVLTPYDRYLNKVARPSLREELDGLSYEDRHSSASFRELRANADELSDATIGVVRVLLASECGDHLIRYGVL